MNEEKSIIQAGVVYIDGHLYKWASQRMNGLVRHEIFFGTANRKKSIQYGLVVFLKPEDHNMSEYGVHCICGHNFDRYLKELGQRSAMKHYGWSEERFRDIFGKSYIKQVE